MKQMMHKARDLPINYEINFIKRTLTMHVDWIDSSLIKSFIKSSAVNAVNREFENVGKLPSVTNINSFTIEMIVGGKARFDVQLVERDFEPR